METELGEEGQTSVFLRLPWRELGEDLENLFLGSQEVTLRSASPGRAWTLGNRDSQGSRVLMGPTWIGVGC